MFGHSDQITYRYQELTVTKSKIINNQLAHVTERAISNVMTGNVARDTQTQIDLRFPDNKDTAMVPVLMYGDGTTCNKFSNISIGAVYVTIGNFDNDLLNKSYSRMCLGYMPDLNTIPWKLIERHLLTTFSPNKAYIDLQIKTFKHSVLNRAREFAVEPLKVGAVAGLKLHELGHDPKIISTLHFCF